VPDPIKIKLPDPIKINPFLNPAINHARPAEPLPHKAADGPTLVLISIALLLTAGYLIAAPVLAFQLDTWTPVWLGACILIGLHLLLVSALIVHSNVKANRQARDANPE